MFGLWSVIGKACTHRSFCEDTYRNTSNREPPDLEKLFIFLIEENGFLLSRWEVGEINRVFQTERARRRMLQIHDSVTNATLEGVAETIWDQKIWAVIGAACLDTTFCRNLRRDAAKGGGCFQDMVVNFNLNVTTEVQRVRNLFRYKETVDLMEGLEAMAWTRPGKCAWSYTFEKGYRHT